MKRLPAESFLRRPGELRIPLQTRIPRDLKKSALEAVNTYGTSLNRLVEAALRWYLEELKKEKK